MVTVTREECASGVQAGGTPIAAFQDVLAPGEIRELVLFIREQAGLAKGRPQVKADPDGAVVDSEKQQFRVEVVARDLETPWGLAFLPDGRLLITERPGRLRIVQNGTLLPPVSGIPRVGALIYHRGRNSAAGAGRVDRRTTENG